MRERNIVIELLYGGTRDEREEYLDRISCLEGELSVIELLYGNTRDEREKYLDIYQLHIIGMLIQYLRAY